MVHEAVVPVLYREHGKLKQLVSEMMPPAEYENRLQQIDDEGTGNLKQPVSEFPLPFACVPWGRAYCPTLTIYRGSTILCELHHQRRYQSRRLVKGNER